MLFDWTFFSNDDLWKMNIKLENAVYGHIYAFEEDDKYIADVKIERNKDSGRAGITISVFESDNTKAHAKWIGDVKSIHTATNYLRFKSRAEKEIKKMLKKSMETVKESTKAFYVGQPVLCRMDHRPYKGTVSKVEDDHILVDIPGVSDHCWFEPGFNLDWVKPMPKH